jgi:hypothetical protein
MQLAKEENKETLEEAKRSRGADLGVGAARAALAKPKTEEEKAQAKQARARAKAAKAERREEEIQEANEAASASIEDQLRDLAPDEVLKALTDADWDVEQLTELAKLLNDHLAARRKVEAHKSPTTTTATSAEAVGRRM